MNRCKFCKNYFITNNPNHFGCCSEQFKHLYLSKKFQETKK